MLACVSARMMSKSMCDDDEQNCSAELEVSRSAQNNFLTLCSWAGNMGMGGNFFEFVMEK